jgi:hypothetical protein
MNAARRPSSTGLRQFLDLQQQRDWMQGKTTLRDADERSESLELRLKYLARFEKLWRRPQAQEVLEILRRYGRDCLPIPRRTERHYWSVSCLPSSGQGTRPRQCELDGAFLALCGRRGHPCAFPGASFRFHHRLFTRSGPGGRRSAVSPRLANSSRRAVRCEPSGRST